MVLGNLHVSLTWKVGKRGKTVEWLGLGLG